MKYPIPQKREHVVEMFGDSRKDEYFWLKNIKDEPEVTKLLEDENLVTKKYLSDVETLQEDIFDEMRSRQLENYESYPYKHDDYLYYERYAKDKEYAIHCRKKVGSNTEEICLDENQLAKGHEYFSLGFFDVSTDHKILAYCVDTDGSELYTLKFKNLETGELLKDEVEGLAPSGCWFKDCYAFTYVIQNENQRPYKVLIHTLGSDKEEFLYEEKSGEFFVSVEETLDHEFVLVSSGGSITNETWYLKGNDPKDPLKLFSAREDGHEYSVDHKNGIFFVTTNDIHQNFRVATTDIVNTDRANWNPFIDGSDDTYLSFICCYDKFLALKFKENGLSGIKLIFNDSSEHILSFPENAYSVDIGDNAEFYTNTFRYDYSSLTTPDTSYDFDIDSKISKLVYQREVPTFDPSLYKTQRVSVKSHDGALVPMTILHKKGLENDGSNPTLLYGYGAYGLSISPSFNGNIFSLVDRGFIFAIAHIRGSTTLGRSWYEDGKFLKKINTFLDFNCCAEYLINENFTKEGEIIINGGSAGGLLVAAAVNFAPSGLYKAVVAEVPFVDTLNTMLDSSLPLTELEYDEWGNPEEEKYYHYIKSYSPYDNIQEREYPAILATGGLNDPRVTYWEPMKWIYRLRDTTTDSNVKLLHMNMDAGHGGASGRYEYLKEDAMIYTFILKQFNITE